MGSGGPAELRTHPPLAIVSLVFGIAGVVFILPLIGPVLALVFGYLARGEVQRDPDRYSDDLARVGRILGWVGLGLSVLFGLAVALFIMVLLGTIGLPFVAASPVG